MPTATALTRAATARPRSDRLRIGAPDYRLRLADCAADLRAAQALRFGVFNVELQEGLADSFASGLDADAFDAVCDHLLVQESRSGAIVGTYRLQTGLHAREHLGYYSAREFDFAPFEPYRAQLLELGRACIHRDHRSFAVLSLLWRGIADYAQRHQALYLIGCSSLTSGDSAIGAAAWQRLRAHLAPPCWRTRPMPGFACALAPVASDAPRTPKLLAAYLSLGAMMCSAPAIDREFGTIDFLTLVDLSAPTQARRLARFGISI